MTRGMITLNPNLIKLAKTCLDQIPFTEGEGTHHFLTNGLWLQADNHQLTHIYQNDRQGNLLIKARVLNDNKLFVPDTDKKSLREGINMMENNLCDYMDVERPNTNLSCFACYKGLNSLQNINI